ncbi:metallopeptidase TldD-related protein [Nocardiopsis suaedae]|uniref:Metallopeptidase TldD-related protein n=1 Tax=Nocardiopsis suaedae TaxID=3018444 RepID=A0ABT4TS77_9ACTN|nr:metallopeptidase TldD-related protein [Nocardiopsis suaedae]MDA2807527.1 metallopeptidase TldD-related protein [Nocardiopsis suaedae]
MSVSTPQELVERALGLSRADGCMVLVRERSSANLRWAGSSLTTNGAARSRSVTVVALVDGPGGAQVGVVERGGLRDGELEGLVRAAEKAASSAIPTEEAVPLASPEEAGRGGDWDAPPAATGVEVFSETARGLGRVFRGSETSERLHYGFAEHTVVSTFLGTSTGVRLRHDQPEGTIEMNTRAEGSDPRSAWVGRSAPDFAAVDPEALDAELARRAGWASRRVELPAGRYEAVLPPEAVADLMVPLYWDSGARDALEGRSALSAPDGGTRVGERVAGLPLNLLSDPGYAGLECAPFVIASSPGRDISAFDNGLPLRRTDWISEGVLNALGQTRATARRTGMEPTGFIDNLVLDLPGAAGGVDEMVARTERGLLLTCLWYIRSVDPQTMLQTGLTRDGVYLVEDGRVTGAVNNFRFNESPLDLLGRATEAGASVPALSREAGDVFPRTAMPPLRIPDFNMSTVSKAS